MLSPVGLISFDFNNDGCINAKDYTIIMFHFGKTDSVDNGKYYDINKDGVINDSDWELAKNFLLYINPNR